MCLIFMKLKLYAVEFIIPAEIVDLTFSVSKKREQHVSDSLQGSRVYCSLDSRVYCLNVGYNIQWGA